MKKDDVLCDAAQLGQIPLKDRANSGFRPVFVFGKRPQYGFETNAASVLDLKVDRDVRVKDDSPAAWAFGFQVRQTKSLDQRIHQFFGGHQMVPSEIKRWRRGAR